MTTHLDDLAAIVASISTSVTPGVVRLGGWRGANGVVIGAGQVLTNAHNVHRGPITTTFADGRTAAATLAGHEVGIPRAEAPSPPDGAFYHYDILGLEVGRRLRQDPHGGRAASGRRHQGEHFRRSRPQAGRGRR